MTDSSKEPSKGASKAADEIIQHHDARQRKHDCPGYDCVICSLHGDQSTMAEIIDRETKAPQMAALLRELAEYFKASLRRPEFAHQLAEGHPLLRAERLLTEVKP